MISGGIGPAKSRIRFRRLNNNPNEDAVGRASKVGKEEMMGPLTAIEEYTQRDHDANIRLWRGLVESIASDLRGISSVTAEVYVPGLGAHPIDPDEDGDDRLGVGVRTWGPRTPSDTVYAEAEPESLT